MEALSDSKRAHKLKPFYFYAQWIAIGIINQGTPEGPGPPPPLATRPGKTAVRPSCDGPGPGWRWNFAVSLISSGGFSGSSAMPCISRPARRRLVQDAPGQVAPEASTSERAFGVLGDLPGFSPRDGLGPRCSDGTQVVGQVVSSQRQMSTPLLSRLALPQEGQSGLRCGQAPGIPGMVCLLQPEVLQLLPPSVSIPKFGGHIESLGFQLVKVSG